MLSQTGKARPVEDPALQECLLANAEENPEQKPSCKKPGQAEVQQQHQGEGGQKHQPGQVFQRIEQPGAGPEERIFFLP